MTAFGIKWKGQRLRGLKHPALYRSSGWIYDNSPLNPFKFREIEAAHAWGFISMSDFYACDKWEKELIIAWYEAKWRINAINDWERAEEMKRNAKKASKKGRK